MTRTPDLAPGEPVTVTYTDGTTVSTWHGIFTGTVNVLPGDRSDMPLSLPQLRYNHIVLKQRYQPGDGEVGTQEWAQVKPAGAYLFTGQHLASHGPHWMIPEDGNTLTIDPAITGVTITPLTEAGQDFLEYRKSPEAMRQYVTARVRQYSDDLADTLEAVIDALIEQAHADAHEATLGLDA